MLVGHYLGVDHAGHAHGVASAAMADKLAQMDHQIAYVAGRYCRFCISVMLNPASALCATSRPAEPLLLPHLASSSITDALHKPTHHEL
jgi:hypothetical protein